MSASCRYRVTAHPWPPEERAGLPGLLRGGWPAEWIALRDSAARPLLAAYRLRLACPEGAASVPIHVSADERYELWLDGARVGRGAERGDRQHWYYESYLLNLEAGEHMLVARVWSLGGLAPYAQLSCQHGFILASEGAWNERLATGRAPWEGKRLGGFSAHGTPAGGTGCREHWDAAAMAWSWEHGDGPDWGPVRTRGRGAIGGVYGVFEHDQPWLRPAPLSGQLSAVWTRGRVRHVDASTAPEDTPCSAAVHLASEADGWAGLLKGEELSVPPRTVRRVILDLEDYVCGYPHVAVSGGAGGEVDVAWAEALFLTPEKGETKGNRNEVAGRYFRKTRFATPDCFFLDGGYRRAFATLWWRAGRYLQVTVRTAGEALTLHALSVEETRAPLRDEGEFTSDEPRFEALWPLCRRSLQVNAHETYMDCPYFEQQQWVGDTRVQALCAYAVQSDASLQRKALELIAGSQTADGWTAAMWPVRQDLCIPTFSLAWVGMLVDFARWRGERDFVRRLLPAARKVCDFVLSFRDARGLVLAPPGWQYLDWVSAWSGGTPPGACPGPTASLTAFLAWTLSEMADLEAWAGEPELSARWGRLAGELTEALQKGFWRSARGAFSDDPAGTAFSEHTQVLALLARRLPPETVEALRRTLREDRTLAPCSYFFMHYYFEACALLGLGDVLCARLEPWFALPGMGLQTTPETAEATRSDAHAWSAHPIFHARATILGVRPDGYGFEKVIIRPLLGRLTRAAGSIPTPAGLLRIEIHREGERLRARVQLPPGMSGTFRAEDMTFVLREGVQEVG